MKKAPKTAAVLVVAMFLSGCGPSEPQRIAEMSVAAKLASIDAKTNLQENDPSVERMRGALNAASKVCEREPMTTAEMANKARSLLSEEGIQVNNIEVLEMLPQVVGESRFRGGCSEYLAMYMTLRTSGQNHLSATNGLRGIYKAISKK